CFTADADMIFHPKFTDILEKLAEPNKATYFQVGFLNEEESLKDVPFENYKTNFLTNNEATGMTLFPVEKLKLINGFDEFFHFWGAEDTDVHNRLKNLGCEIVYYDTELLLLHQWHTNYRSRETQKLSNELQLSGIVELNHKHLVYNLNNKTTKVNSENWGIVLDNSEFNELSSVNPKILSTEKSKIDHFLYYELPNSKEKTIAIQIKKDGIDQIGVKTILKKLLGRKVTKHYTLKEINDLLLMHIVSFYHKHPYSYKISEDLKSITFKIKKQEI
ncbi:MAG: galactosyltransferase-related protein, partial [Flavobacterium sp.]